MGRHTKLPEPVSCIETFRDPRGWTIQNMEQKEPSCFNGCASVYRWRVTVEKIVEPVEVIQDRLENLYRESGNYHDYDALMRVAKSIGYTFTGKFRQDEKRKA